MYTFSYVPGLSHWELTIYLDEGLPQSKLTKGILAKFNPERVNRAKVGMVALC